MEIGARYAPVVGSRRNKAALGFYRVWRVLTQNFGERDRIEGGHAENRAYCL
jgi:hypothetical protein